MGPCAHLHLPPGRSAVLGTTELKSNPVVRDAPEKLKKYCTVKLVTTTEPSRLDVMNACARGLKYSLVPWKGDQERVVDYLAARKGRHMAVPFGNLNPRSG